MRVGTIADVKASFSTYMKQAEEGPVVVTRNGRTVAVLIAVQDDDELERLIFSHSPRYRAMIEAARARIRAGQGIPFDQFWKELEEEQAPKTRATKTRRKTGRERDDKGKRVAS